MNAVISGRAGLALVIEGDSLMSLDVDDLETLVPRRPSDLRFLLADATDLVTLENTGREEIAERLDLEHDIACALDMTLIALDSDSSMELRAEAVAALDELLADARVIERLEFTMYAKPLPESADLMGALFCTEVKTAAARLFFERLDRDQTAIGAVCEAWDALPDSLFGDDPSAKALFHDGACNEGLFRLLALSYLDQAKVSAFVIEALKNRSINSLRNHGEVLQQWRAPIRAASGAPVIESECDRSGPLQWLRIRKEVQRKPHLSSEEKSHAIHKGVSVNVSPDILAYRPRLRILLADDDNLARAAMRVELERLPEVEGIAEARDGQEALRLIQKHKPDLVLIGFAMPSLSEATSRILKEFPDVRVIILSMYANEVFAHEAINAGAAGYLVKRSAASELEHAIAAVARGETYFIPLVSTHVTGVVTGRAGADRALINRLTPRQREILQLIAERHSTKEIAQVLSLSVKTVETHRAQLMERLGVHDMPGLVRFAIRTGVVSLEE